MVIRHPSSVALSVVALVVALTATTEQAVAQGNKKPTAPPTVQPQFCTINPPSPPPCPQPNTYGVSVSPKGTAVSQPSNSTGHTASFSVTNTGNTSNTYSFTCSSTGPVTCTSVSPTSASVGSELQVNVTVTYSVAAPGSGTLTLSASGFSASGNGYYNVTVTAPPPPAVAVTPKGQTATTRAANTAGYSETFTITNTGTIQTTYTLSCSGSSNVTCSGTSVPSVTLAAGAATTATASYSVGAAGTGTLSLTAAAGGVSDVGSYSIPVVSYGVAVTPDGQSVTVPPGTSASQTFTVQNTGSVNVTYNLAVTCSGAASGCATPVSVAVQANTSSPVTVTYQTGTPGTAGSAKLVAVQAGQPSVRDSGWVNLTVSGAGAPLVAIADPSPGPTVERALCLTIAAGTGAAYECGDLRLVHALPTTRTLNKARTPTLLYNSAYAHPYPRVAANVTLPAGAATPDSIVATLRFGAVFKGRGKWAGTGWVSGATRRIVVGYDGLADTTGTYAYTLEVVNWYPAAVSQASTASGQLAVVNRQASPFGAGWWLAGLERLNVGDMRWVGGDGSARQYQLVATGVWAGPNVDRPDTLKFDGTNYVRILPHGVRVKFDAQGKHTQTVNRLQHVTTFGYDACGRLSAITLPPASAGRSYQFIYASATDCTTRLTSVTAPPAGTQPRTTVLTLTGTQVTAIRDPDSTSITFGLDAGFANRVVSRTDRRLSTTYYAFDPSGKVVTDSLPLGTGQTPIVQRFQPLESLGLTGTVDTAGARTLLDGPRTDAQDTTAFWLDGFGAPRKIVNAIGFATVLTRGDGRWPALVTKAVYPNGRVMLAAYDGRGNVIQEVDSGTSRIGLVVPPCDTTRPPCMPGGPGLVYAKTRYTWDPKWDLVTTIVRPELDSVVLAYDSANGNRVWQQAGSDAARRVTFRYGNGLGLLSSTLLPQTPADSIEYDALGNLAATRTPRGFWTSHYRDALGRDTLVVTPIGSTDTSRGGALDSTARLRERTVYDRMDRDTLAETIAQARIQTIQVKKTYDQEGNLLSLSRASLPDASAIGKIVTRWRYDGAGRRVAEVAPDDTPGAPRVDSTVYDPAGNALKAITRRADTLYLSYDPLNRLTKRVTTPVRYPQRTEGIAASLTYSGLKNRPYPYYSNDPSGGFTIARDSALYDYDPLGNYRFANNSDAQVQRDYYPSGLIKTETQRIRTVAGADFTTHVYTITYRYDLDGRRIAVKNPSQLVPTGTADSAIFQYDPQIGTLAMLTDLLGNQFQYAYTLRGELQSIQLPTGIVDQRTYDADGNLAQNTVTGKRQTGFQYDARGKLLRSVNTSGYLDTLTATYDGLGYLETSSWVGHGFSAGIAVRLPTDDAFHYDAFGNATWNQHVDSSYANGTYTGSNTIFRFTNYWPGTGRLAYANTTYLEDTVRYDAAGNTEFKWQKFASGAPNEEDRASYYAADGQLRAADYRSQDSPNGFKFPIRWVFEEYRYDALGRRIWVRARKDCDYAGATSDYMDFDCHVGLLRRTVWDGAQELWEIQVPGDDLTTADTLENDILAVQRTWGASSHYIDINPFFGRVAYTYGLGVDEPLAITRVAYADQPSGQPWASYGPFGIIPFWNYRGQADTGYFAGGVPRCQTVNGSQRCALMAWIFGWDPRSQMKAYRAFWQGTLLEDKRDKAQTMYRRARVYDPATGRFTQEDPLGLAGGLNLYGFANGDPVNFSDPFGLCAWHEMECWNDKILALGATGGAVARYASAAASLALELTGGVSVDEHARGAAGGSKMAMAALIFDIGVNAIPGGGEGKAALSRLIKDASENPGAWRLVGAFTEAATNKAAKGGLSIQAVMRNEAGDQLVRHTVLDQSGKVIEEHYRPMYKPRDVDTP